MTMIAVAVSLALMDVRASVGVRVGQLTVAV